MAVLAASNNEGRYNRVHRQTDDGSIISVAMGSNLTPLVFRYKNYLGCDEESVLSAAFFPHKRLMRGDCGWSVENDSVDISYSWNASYDVIDGLSAGPSGEYVVNYHTEYDNASDAILSGFRGHRTVYRRKDREYWTPDKTLDAVSVDDTFGFSQYNPYSCPPKEPNKCGIVEFYPRCHKKGIRE